MRLGPNKESCCTTLEVAGGAFYRTYDVDPDLGGANWIAPDGGATGLADPATVSTFVLDKYDVTVGRFRQFVNAWNGGAGYTPAAGSGKHTHLNGGKGLLDVGSPDALGRVRDRMEPVGQQRHRANERQPRLAIRSTRRGRPRPGATKVDRSTA